MKDILIIAHFTQIPGEAGNGRFHYIAKNIDKQSANVEVVTTNFSHRTKKHRNLNESDLKNIDYKITMIQEPGYKKNVSLLRFYSHFIMGRNLYKYLRNRKKPDLIYCAIPSLDVGNVVANYANANDIKLIIDIQDLWPEAFRMIFNLPIIARLLFLPWERKANRIYSSSDEIVAVSQTYVDRALQGIKKSNTGHSIYLGTELKCFDVLADQKIEKPVNEVWLAYIGTLGHSYDLKSVMKALKILEDKGIGNIRFIVLGDGPLKDEFQNFAKSLNIAPDFRGRVNYGEMVRTLKKCDIAINPIIKGSAGSIINKVGDYAAAGLPVINTQECEEYRTLLTKYRSGINCICEDAEDIARKLEIIILNKDLRKQMGHNSRILAQDKFDRTKTYKKILDLIDD